MLRIIVAVTALLWIMASCTQPEKPLTKEEVRDFAKKIELSIEKREGKILDEAFDSKAFFKRMNLEDGKDNRSIQSGIMEGMKMGTKLVTSLTEKGSYSFIKQYEKDKVQHIMFRLYDQGSINYHDFELKRTKGEPRIVDVYVYTSGETLSETIKNLFADFKGEFFDNATPQTDAVIKRLPDIRMLIVKGKHLEALDIYNSLSEKMQKSRPFQIIHVEICSGLTDDEYTSSIAEYEKLYPNEPNMQLLLIDGYILRKEYVKALTAVNELDKMINKDPLLDYHRAMCYTLIGEKSKRTECLERVVKNVPDFEDGILELIADYLGANEFEKARPLVRRFKNKSAFDQSRLNDLIDQYPGYN